MYNYANSKKSNFFSGLVLILVVSILVSVYFLRYTSEFNTATSAVDANLVVVPKTFAKIVVQPELYTDVEYDFQLTKPSGWEAEVNKTGAGVNEIYSVILSSDISDKSVSISVMDTSLSGLVENSISISSQTELNLGNEVATRFVGSSLKDGSAVTMISVTFNGRLYSFKGVGTEFEEIVKSFKFQ